MLSVLICEACGLIDKKTLQKILTRKLGNAILLMQIKLGKKGDVNV